MNAPTSNARYVEGPRRVPEGIGLSVSSVASVQFGAAIAAHLFPLVGPLGTVSLRLAGASLVLVALTRPWRRRWARAELGSSLLFGLIFVLMNSSLYLALDRLPLATVVTIEFLGPLTLSIVTARSWRERVWAMPAAAGVAAIGGAIITHSGTSHSGITHGGIISGGGTGGGSALIGAAFALTAALGWAAYIVMSGRVGRTGTGLAGLSLANAVAAVIVLPFGLVTAGSTLWRPSTLAIGLAVGVLSSAIPYSFDLLSLRRLPTAVFGVLTSLNPAVAALAGLLVLDQTLPIRQIVGIALVMTASAGISITAAKAVRSSTGGPAEGPPGQQVRVDVEDALADPGPGVEHRAELGDVQRVGRRTDPGEHLRGQLGVPGQLDDVAHVHPRHDEHVGRGLRVDVAEGDDRVVGEDDVDRDVTGDHRAEHAPVDHGPRR